MLNINIKKEVTLGQVLSAVFVVAGFLVGYGILQAEVTSVKEENEQHRTFVTREDFDELRQDVRDIRNMVFNYVSKNPRPTSQGSNYGPPSNGGVSESGNQYYDNPYSADLGRAGQTLRAGPDSTRTNSNKSKTGR